MIIPKLLRGDRYRTNTVSFGGHEIVFEDYNVVSHVPRISSHPSSTFNPFISEVELVVRLGFDEAQVYKNTAAAAISILQEAGPAHKFYRTENPGVLGIAGREFRAVAMLKVYAVPVEMTGGGLTMPMARKLPPVSKNFWELSFNAICGSTL